VAPLELTNGRTPPYVVVVVVVVVDDVAVVVVAVVVVLVSAAVFLHLPRLASREGRIEGQLRTMTMSRV
jgi:hypothetical protein